MAHFAERSDLSINLYDVDVVEHMDGPIQQITLLKHPKLGQLLVINGELQHVEAWQALYHEPLVHVSGAFVPDIRKALVLGGGSLFAASEILRYPSVSECTLVDHDPAVLSLMARHYPHARKVLSDPRFKYIKQDAVAYLQSDTETYDLVINDCIDLLSIGSVLRMPLFPLLTRRLEPEGMCADLVYRHLWDGEHTVRTLDALQQFGPIALSLVTVPEYPGVLHLLTMWGNKSVDQHAKSPRNRMQLHWCKMGMPTNLAFYNPNFLPYFLYLPPYVKQAWE